jgi:hypothetical protein
MSYYNTPDSFYRVTPPALPGWQQAPVPGWGANPARAGSPIVGASGVESILPSIVPISGQLGDPLSDQQNQLVANMAFSGAAGLVGGMLLMYVAFATKMIKPPK